MNNSVKLKTLISEIDMLIEKRVDTESPEFVAWKTKAERFLISAFGKDSYEYKAFSNTSFLPMLFSSTTESEYVDACRQGLEREKAVFETYLEDFDESEEVGICEKKHKQMPTSIFIVHGHNEGLKQAVARLLEKQNIEAVILHEQPNLGATIIEKFEENSKVGAAICLFSADDIGRKIDGSEKERKRARQNVVFEAGFFMGKLGRNRVILLVDPEIDIPSDLQGVVYTNSKYWEYEVLKELKAIGYEIDLNKSI